MVTERAEDLKALMHDNATFIQFPPIGSSTSLITVIGDNRVNVQRTIRSIMQLVCHRAVHGRTLWVANVLVTGLPILRRIIMATAGAVQRSHALAEPEPFSGLGNFEAGLLLVWSRSRLQGHVFRDAWLGARSPSCRLHAP